MFCHTRIIPYLLDFKKPAGTSRQVYYQHQVYYVVLTDPDDPSHQGIGECAPLPHLSCDALPQDRYLQQLEKACLHLAKTGQIAQDLVERFPSICFGLETALQHYRVNDFALWETPFSQGKEGININGLIWMGEYADMHAQIESKLAQGFHCIKLKIGAIDFEKELALLKSVRQHFSEKEITLRVDANGAFSPQDALEKLYRLAEFSLHSIEQPIAAGQWDAMAVLVDQSPIPIGLDEELIGLHTKEQKQALMSTVHPDYLIIKPSLHDGLRGAHDWISLAEQHNKGWWLTSALESNVGLNAIAQWAAKWNTPLPQGLGTGLLYKNNLSVPLSIKGESLYFLPQPQQQLMEQVLNQVIPNKWQSISASQTIMIEGQRYTANEFKSELTPDFVNRSEFHQQLYLFLKQWFADDEILTLYTSGSTGQAKPWQVKKQDMCRSAQLTCDYLNLKPNDTALLCLPLTYIAGKMMVVRTLVAHLDLYLVTPTGNPLLAPLPNIAFTAMVPNQIYDILKVEESYHRLREIKNILIGGAAIPDDLVAQLASFSGSVYATYGMTETLSHVALRCLNGKNASEFYRPFKHVSLSLNKKGCLVIQVPYIGADYLETHDCAIFNEKGEFRVLGRYGNIINSGGVKIQIEAVETALKPWIDGHYAIAPYPDPKFGYVVVLVVEIGAKIQKEALAQLDIFCRPKFIFDIEKLPITQNGKISRSVLKQWLVDKYSSTD